MTGQELEKAKWLQLFVFYGRLYPMTDEYKKPAKPVVKTPVAQTTRLPESTLTMNNAGKFVRRITASKKPKRQPPRPPEE